MLRNYTERLAGQLPFPSQKRKFIEDVVRDVAAPQVRSQPIAGKTNDDILAFLDNADPITRSSTRNLDSLMDVYVDRTFERFLDIANPDPEAARSQISGVIEGLVGATAAVQKLGRSFQWTSDADFARDLLTGAAARPLTEALTPEEATSSGAQALSESSDPTGMAMRSFLDQAGTGSGLLAISDQSAIRAAKKTWGIWEKIGALSRANMQISTPDFASNPGHFKHRVLVAQKVDKSLSEQLAGGLARKGAQMANRARAPQGKMVRKMILLSDALGIFSGNIISNERVLNRDDNLAQAIAGGSGVGVGNLFPRGTLYANPESVRQVTDLLLREERDGRIVTSKEYRKFKAQNSYRVVLDMSRGKTFPPRPERSQEQKQEDPQMARTGANLPQTRRGKMGRSESMEKMTQSERAKRQKIEDKPLPGKGRPLGGSTNPNRLLVTSDTVSNVPSLPKAGGLLKHVNPTNPDSILKANESLTSTNVAPSNIVDPTASRMQSQLVRDQNHENPDMRLRLRSSCVQMANAKSAAALSQKATQLATMTRRADTLSGKLISERRLGAEKVEALKSDLKALQSNNGSLQGRWEDLEAKYRGIKGKYDRETKQWREFQIKHKQTVGQLRDAHKAKAKNQREVTAAAKVTESQLLALRRQLERFGSERSEATRARSRLEDQIRAQEKGAKRDLAQRDAHIRDVEAKLKVEKEDNFRMSENNAGVMEDQLRLREELQSANAECDSMRDLIEQMGRDNNDRDLNIRDLTNELQSMRAVVEGARGVAIQQSMRAMVSGQESQVLLAQRERQGQMNRNLMWQSAEMQKSLNRAEEEVRAARDQCPVRVGMDVDWQTGAPWGGWAGGGFSGEGGASMRPLPEWFGEKVPS